MTAARYTRGFDIDAASRHLRKVDKPLAAWMRRIGPLPEPVIVISLPLSTIVASTMRRPFCWVSG